MTLATVVITNFNYEKYVAECVESALAQSHKPIEIVVVDDGSTDCSRNILRKYTDRVKLVLQDNAGQSSAMNAGYSASAGDVVCFLDSDDLLHPCAIADAVRALAAPNSVKVHWPMEKIDASGNRLHQWIPQGELAHGDLSQRILWSPEYGAPPQSGNSWSRSFLDLAMPLPVSGFETGGADTYLSLLSIIYGEVRRVTVPRGFYRVHQQSNWTARPFDERMNTALARHEATYQALAMHCRSQGLRVNLESWRRNSWFHRVREASSQLASLISPQEPFILIDDMDWGMSPDARWQPIPFPSKNGNWEGYPRSSSHAISCFCALQSQAKAVVLTWRSFWWLEHYAEFFLLLRPLESPSIRERAYGCIPTETSLNHTAAASGATYGISNSETHGIRSCA